MRSNLYFTAVFFLLPLLSRANSEPAHPEKSEKSPAKPSTEGARKLVDKMNCEALPQKSTADLWKMSDCYFKLGNAPKSTEILQQITRKNPKDLEAYFTTSWLLWNEGHARGGEEEKKKNEAALTELNRARVSNPTHWEVDREVGDFFLLRLKSPEKAYPEFLKARAHFDGDFSRGVPGAERGAKAAIEGRIARVAEALGNKGEAVEASCRALYFDPDDTSAEKRIETLGGSCVRKQVKDPTQTEAKPVTSETTTPKKSKPHAD